MTNVILFALMCGVLGVIYAAMTAMWVSKQDAGTAKMQEISNAVKEGAYAFLAREYKTVAIVAVVLVILIAAIGTRNLDELSVFLSARSVPHLPALSACGLQSGQMYAQRRQHTKAFRLHSALHLRAVRSQALWSLVSEL